MKISDLLAEAKLTESGFQLRPSRLLHRYRNLDEVFEVTELPIVGERVRGYQLIREIPAHGAFPPLAHRQDSCSLHV